MKKLFLFLLINTLFLFTLAAQAPDAPISPAEAVSMLGKGILMEPQAGNVEIGFSAKYKPALGDSIVAAGYQSVRIRYQGTNNPMMKAIADGPPYDAQDAALLDETDSIITDLLNKNLAVVLTFYGLTDDKPGDLDKMVSWWGYVTNRFKNKSHRLIFDLFVEPLSLVGNSDPHRIMDYYNAITTEIRKTNPDRIIIYFRISPADAGTDPYGPGTEYFMTRAYNPVPQDAGIYYMWDFHALKPDVRDNVRLVEQAWEYMDSTKQVVWSGAWNAKNTTNEMWYAKPMAYLTTRRFIDRGISFAYLMFFDGKTSLYDVENVKNNNGILNEWIYPGFQKIMTSGPSVWWNMLSNPGFETGIKKWTVSGGSYTVEMKNEDHFLQLPKTSGSPITVAQDVTLALKNNGPGNYDVLAYVGSQGNSTVQFVLTGTAGGNDFRFESPQQTVSAGRPQLVHMKINADWRGKLENATLSVLLTGDASTLDKTGLTQFFYPHPKLNISLWPGERIHHDNYTPRSNSVMNINGQLRNLINQGISNNDSRITAIADSINNITYDLETRLIALLGNDYQRTPEGTQYRLGGYNQGTTNSQYKNDVAKYIGGKDPSATQLNKNLITEQNKARDYFIENNIAFRKFFYDVFRGYPPEIESQTGIDTTVLVSGKTLTANETGAAYRWLDCENLYNPIGGATGRSFSPKISGKYAVEITKNSYVVKSGCHKMSFPTGIPSFSKDFSTKVYPTLVKNVIHIETENEHSPFKVIIFDLQGRKIATYAPLYPPSSRITLNVKRGLYLLEVVFPSRTETFKIVKQ